MTINPLELLKVLGDASGWVVAVFILMVFGWGFHKEWWVPGRVHQREIERGNASDEALKASTAANEKAAKANVDLTHAFEDLTDVLYDEAPQTRLTRPRRRGRARE